MLCIANEGKEQNCLWDMLKVFSDKLVTILKSVVLDSYSVHVVLLNGLVRVKLRLIDNVLILFEFHLLPIKRFVDSAGSGVEAKPALYIRLPRQMK